MALPSHMTQRNLVAMKAEGLIIHITLQQPDLAFALLTVPAQLRDAFKFTLQKHSPFFLLFEHNTFRLYSTKEKLTHQQNIHQTHSSSIQQNNHGIILRKKFKIFYKLN
jgi:hypothetical protein